MPRKRRVEFPGAIYHVTVRGNGRQNIFLSDADRERFLESLSKRIELHAVRLYLYCLMDNHIHMVVETPRGNLSSFMASVLTSYAVYFNKRHGSSGHLTQGRYHTSPVEGDDYILKLSRYVHLNPVKVPPVHEMELTERRRKLKAYRWSSYHGYIGVTSPVAFVSYGPILAMFGRNLSERMVRYQKFVEGGLATTDDEWLKIMKRSNHGIGSEYFREELRSRIEPHGDVSFRKRSGALLVEQVMGNVCRFYGISTDEIIQMRRNDRVKPAAAWLLRKFCGLKHREVSGLLGVKTEAAVSFLLKRAESASLQNDIQKITQDLSSGTVP